MEPACHWTSEGCTAKSTPCSRGSAHKQVKVVMKAGSNECADDATIRMEDYRCGHRPSFPIMKDARMFDGKNVELTFPDILDQKAPTLWRTVSEITGTLDFFGDDSSLKILNPARDPSISKANIVPWLRSICGLMLLQRLSANGCIKLGPISFAWKITLGTTPRNPLP